VTAGDNRARRPATRLAGDTTAAHVCHDVPLAVPEATSGEVRAALSARPYESVADVVVCDAGRLVGLVPAEVVLAVLLSEHEEDLVRLSGVLRSTSAARRAREEPVGRRIAHRLPSVASGSWAR
jgi:magnesium transporter